MGITVRREPVSYKIPDYPDYEYLDVTDFQGIEMSDNPFSTSKNTASDALNVYVDEVNVLTTRPRLSKIIKNPSKANEELYGVYSTSKGYLYHYANAMCLVKIEYPHESTDITGDIPTGKKLTVFEQDNKIYLLDGKSYKEIGDDFVCKDVTPYVPNTKIYGSNIDEGHDDEAYNFLTDEYKESYFWDGTWDPESLRDKYTSDIQISEDYVTTKNNISGDSKTRILTILGKRIPDEDFVWNGLTFVAMTYNTNDAEYYGQLGAVEKIEIITLGNSGKIVLETLDVPSKYLDQMKKVYIDDIVCIGSVNGKHLLFVVNDKHNNTPKCIFARRYDKWFDVDINTDGYSSPEAISPSFITSDGNFLGFTISTSNDNFAVGSDYDTESSTFKNRLFTFPQPHVHEKTAPEYIVASEDGKCIVGSWRTGYTDTYRYELSTDYGKTFELHDVSGSFGDVRYIVTSVTSSYEKRLQLSIDGKIMLLGRALFKDVINSEEYVSVPTNDSDICLILSESGDKVFMIAKNDENLLTETGWFVTENESKVNFPLKTNIYVESDFDLNVQTKAYTNAVYVIDYSGIKTSLGWSSAQYNYMNAFTLNTNLEYPTIFVTSKINEKDSFYETWSELKDLFFANLQLTTRFNNERWFSSGNAVFWTRNNNPAYITDARRLGETNEAITGFNLASDDLLVVYKDNYLYSIQLSTINDTGVYVYNDSKNTVGNNAIGATIISAYTEIPLQIAYDGIYGLKQLKNVQSSDRISELMSEDISKKWLNESKEAVKNCKTLNRFYWTYFILSYKDLTKIYLLDNRNNSWFYWKLPVEILNAFVRDDVVEGDTDRVINVLFADVLGNIYVLKTSDQINKYNPNLTEYYDDWYPEDDPKIIPWFWRSQIMSLGTTAYAKKLDTTTFVNTDTDSTDEYGLNYKFRVYRKSVGETKPEVVTDNINYVKSVTKRTNILRFKFLQIELSNIADDLNNNKLRLVGLDLKYEILGGVQ